MPLTPDAFDGPSFEEAVEWEEQASDPAKDKRLQYVQGKGLVILDDGVVRAVGENREAIWQTEVDDVSVNTPPGSPVAGDRVIVGGSPTGAFVGHEGEVAQYTGSTWVFSVPREGTIAYVKSKKTIYAQRSASSPWAWGASGLFVPTEVGQMIYSYNGMTFEIVKPMVSDKGFILTNDHGHTVVVE